MHSIWDDFKGAFSKTNNALMKIIFINVVIFLVCLIVGTILKLSHQGNIYGQLIYQLGLSAYYPYLLEKPWSLFTYFFVHENIWHILFNMLGLYWFGKLIEEYLGSKRVLSLYILGGLAGGITYLLMYNFIPYYEVNLTNSIMIGASAGLYALVVAAATLLPNHTFFLMFLGPIRIKYLAAFYIIISFAGITNLKLNAGGNIAHLGGALLGYIFIILLKRGIDIGKPITITKEAIESIFKRKPKMKITYSSTKSKAGKAYQSDEEPNQAEIDFILDKISHSGYESLTKEEKQKLFKASKK